MTIHLLKKAQIATLKQDEAFAKVSAKYSDFSDVFSEKKALVLPELQDDKQPLYGPIYSLGPVELETLKAYIETYLKTRFI